MEKRQVKLRGDSWNEKHRATESPQWNLKSEIMMTEIWVKSLCAVVIKDSWFREWTSDWIATEIKLREKSIVT